MYYGQDIWSLANLTASLGIFVIIMITVSVLCVAAKYVSAAVIFMKAGEAPWKSLIPFYNDYTYFKLFWDVKIFILFIATEVGGIIGAVLSANYSIEAAFSYYYGGAAVAAVIGSILTFICGIASFVVFIMLQSHISTAFGKDGGFTVGLIFLNLIFKMILAFGNAEIKKNEPVLKPQNNIAAGSIRIISGDLRGKSVNMAPGQVISIGRSPQKVSLAVDVNNPNSKVSRKHCEIEFDAAANTYYVRDLSVNGTSLSDGTRLVKDSRIPVRRGSELILPGDIRFVLE